ncbi:uncharacterized protein KY384_008969 [Bacidia gigantensis]|uniref:uncharacterized protein n=1 Tax=Bacidia gigantensis TaxID=2732470 RepID=UPI001D0430D1|nr:uncharacterized protein KY384_008969 [Bacidia gigantensis]KAG8525325.1 hypothetical protein KY384_008969 [Bacidia gigantensis]
MVDIERQTGLSTVWHPGKPCCDRLGTPEARSQFTFEIDFENITRDLTSMTTKVSYCEYATEIHLPMLDSVDDINSKAIARATSDHRDKRIRAEARIRVQIKLLRSSLKGTHSRAKYLSKRAQAQVQTVYSLIAQKDNAFSMRDNAALKTISEDQKRIALIATQDSAAMRIVAAIATVFVPATFTATLFSTTFFNFQAGNGEKLVSRWLWLYFAVTICLSSGIMVWWHVTSRRKVHAIHKAFGEGVDDKHRFMLVFESKKAPPSAPLCMRVFYHIRTPHTKHTLMPQYYRRAD